MFNLEEELKKLPDKPGVYLMHDKHDNIIYVGKAKNLKNRVRQYFQGSRRRMPKIEKMVSLIDYFEYIIVDSEVEALVLECNLIKEHRPKYNTMLMDDKAYPFIKITTGEDYPRVMLARKVVHDKARYFGPYISGLAVKDTLELLRKLYCLRSCKGRTAGNGTDRPCLYYHMKQCKAPCRGYISKEEYAESVEAVVRFLNGNYQSVLNDIEQKMHEAAEKMEFESAAEYRDLAKSVSMMAQKQKITSMDEENRDIIAMARADEEAVVQVFFIREGKMVGREHFHLSGVESETRSSIMTNFIKQFYAAAPVVPRELLLGTPIEDAELITEWLSSKRGYRVYIKTPQKGSKEKLVMLAEKNASLVLQQDSEKLKREEARTIGAVRELERILEIEGIKRMESYDISNISGFESVGSMIVYENGKPKRSDYRKFRIKTVVGADDYASMREVLTRRFTHGMREKEELKGKNIDEKLGSFTKYPQLILMDGGKGQVNIALEVLRELKLDIAVCGMVKDDSHRTRGLYFDNRELPIDTSKELFKLITRIQDETHRFAIEYHRLLRSKEQVRSILDDIEGIGPVRRRSLMKRFESFEAIRDAGIEELLSVQEMNLAAAQSVYNFFHKNGQEG